MIEGNVSGIRKIHLEELEKLEKSSSSAFCDPEILDVIAHLTAFYDREIMVNISRSGRVLSIVVGNAVAVAGGIECARERRLSGVRSVHTHPRGAAELSDLDFSCLRHTRADGLAVAAVNEKGGITGCVTAFLIPDGSVEEVRTADLGDAVLTDKIIETESRWRKQNVATKQVAKGRERAILSGLNVKATDIEELRELADTAGAEIVAVATQNAKPVGATLIGSGKIDDLRNLIQLHDADVVIFDNELTGSQAVHLEVMLGVKVLDRSNLILDIFAARAKSKEGKLQVELAQLRYNMPRLLGSGGTMDKMRSGIGMRGPGEKKLETDRRRIREEITALERELSKLAKERDLRREKRASGLLPTVSLVGYTNAGKSTIMNVLARSDVYVANQLFATLDPVTRRVGSGRESYLLTDTVGFVSKLPHEFIDAFASTLEEARTADLLLVVLDMSDPQMQEKRAVVEETLKSIGADKNPRLYVRNKCDRVIDPFFGYEENSVIVSATADVNIDGLKRAIEERLFGDGEKTTGGSRNG